jgi:hypothetical protein
MKRVLLPLLGAIVAMLVVAAVAGGHGSKGHRSLELVGTEASFSFVDVDPKQASEADPPSPGDAFLISETITQAGNDAGNLYIHCTFVTPAVTQCFATLDLADGQITAQGVIHQDALGEGPIAEFDQAVTGGTGAYSGVGGTVSVRDSAEEGAPSTYTIRLR